MLARVPGELPVRNGLRERCGQPADGEAHRPRAQARAGGAAPHPALFEHPVADVGLNVDAGDRPGLAASEALAGDAQGVAVARLRVGRLPERGRGQPGVAELADGAVPSVGVRAVGDGAGEPTELGAGVLHLVERVAALASLAGDRIPPGIDREPVASSPAGQLNRGDLRHGVLPSVVVSAGQPGGDLVQGEPRVVVD